VDCSHCWELANPALGDFLHRDAMTALLPPKTRESTFRRARLCQFVAEGAGAFLPHGVWASLATDVPVPDGAEVVVALDGSFNGDATALVVASVGSTPHFDVVDVWEAPAGDDAYRVPVVDVEDAIRSACRRWQVVEVVADPFRWTRTLQVLEAEGLPVVEFPWSPARVTAATADFYRACTDGEVTHSGDRRLARHVENAVVVEDARGARLAKERRHSARRIDCAAAALMAHSRATWRATRKKTPRRARSFRR
jgi:phage terminase large subunit-like protein